MRRHYGISGTEYRETLPAWEAEALLQAIETAEGGEVS